MLTSKVYVFVFFGSVAVMIGHLVADTNNLSVTNTNTLTSTNTPPAPPTPTTTTPSPDAEMKCEETPKTACQQAFDNIDTLCYNFTGDCGDYFSVPDIKQRDGFFAVREAALYIAYTKCNKINNALYYYSDGVELEKDKVGGTGSDTSSPSQTLAPTIISSPTPTTSPTTTPNPPTL